MALLFPDTPGPGSTYSAPNGVLYTWDNTLGVWIAELDTPLPPFVILSAGTISGTPAVANILTYTQGVAGGGVAPLNYSWDWKDDLGNILQSGGTSYTVAQGDFGRTIEVELSVTDSATTPVTITGTTTPTATVFRNPFPTGTWNPAGSLIVNPGLLSGAYNGVGPNLTASGCIEAAVATPPTVPSAFSTGTQSIANGQTLAVRWASTAPCGLAPSGTFIQGSVTDGTFENSYSLTVDRVPDPIPDMSDSGVPLGDTVSQQISVPITGINTTAYVTYEGTSTGTSISASLNGVSYFTLATSGQGFPVNNGDTLYIQQTVGTTISTGYTAIIRIGDGTNTASTYTEFTYTATTTNDPSFPNYNPLPSYAPNASPEGLSIVDTGSLGALDGTASGSWGDGSNLVTGTNMLLSIGAGAFTSSITPVNGNTVNVAWDPNYIDGLGDQAIASGSITDGVYTNTYTFTVEKNPVYNIPSDSASLAPGATATIPTRTPNNYNSPVPFYYTPGTNTMLNVQVDINGNGLQSLPSSLGTALTLEPGDTVEIFADLGPNPTTVYSITINMGAFSGLWSETSQAIPAIAQPTLVAPTGSPPALLDPGLNSPSGITLVSSAYSASGGAGTQTTSTYEVYEGGYPLLSTNTISGVGQGTPVTWTSVLDPLEGTFVLPTTAMYFSGSGGSPANTFVTSQANSSVFTSTDAQTWTRVTDVPSALFVPAAFLNAGGLWLVVGDSGTGTPQGYIYSSTSVSGPWTQRYSASQKVPFVLAYGNSTFVSIARDASGGAVDLILSSSNGFAWTSQIVPTTAVLTDLSFANGLFVITTADGEVLTSSDGSTWSATSVTPASSLNGVTYGNSKWFVTGDGGNIYSSPDTVTWTQETSGTTSSLKSIATDGTGFVAEVTNTSTVLSSPDGVNWTLGPLPAGKITKQITYGNGIWVGSGTGTGGSGGANNYNLISTAPFAPTDLTISGAQTDGFQIGDIIISNPAGSGPGTIVAISNTSVSITPAGATWNTGDKIERDPTSYTALTGSPYSGTTPVPPTDPSAFIPVADLTPSENYFWRAQYATNTPSAITSPWSSWNEFATSSSFSVPIGTPMGGGYFAGQIMVFAGEDDGVNPAVDTLYNLIVAPVEGDTSGPVIGGGLQGTMGGSSPTGLFYRTFAIGDLPSATVQNVVYGGNTSDLFKASAAHPVFSTFINGASGPNAGAFDLATGGSGGGTGIGGYNDWYLPAKNELEILYYNLKPGTANNVGSGINPNAVPARSSSYTSTVPSRTSATDFQLPGGSQAFVAADYWSSSEFSGYTGDAWRQSFNSGQQQAYTKLTSYYTRAIRRIPA